MQLFSVPTSDSNTWYSQVCTLSAVQYTLELRFNSRMQRWILNILDAGAQPILMGVPLLINRSLTFQYPALPLPPGALFVLDSTDTGTQPTLGSFNKTHTLYYSDPTA